MCDITSDLEWALWCALECRCDYCNADAWELLEDIDPIIDESPIRWATVAADRVRPIGWTGTDGSELLCPACSQNANESATGA